MIRFPDLVRFYLSTLHQAQPSIPMIGPFEARRRHDLDAVPQAACRGIRMHPA